ncbi:hypothetical protein [Streptomyces sp. NPDC005795]|uniref:hypothetical protein n=1 Tax=Streptomyces sp. NPDC005795 TaxID=3154677 RepID=UPI0033E351AE
MAGEVSDARDAGLDTELIISPRSQGVRDDLADAPGWPAYVARLRAAVATVIAACDVDALEVGELLVSLPLPEVYADLRNGVEVGPAEAIDLVEAMVAGHGPYCGLSGPGRLRIESGWDGAVHLYVAPAAASELPERLRDGELSIEWRQAAPEPVEVTRPVEAVADDDFWKAVREVSERVTLVCERWAHGAYGCRWFRVTPQNADEVARLVQPRSLLCVAVDPDLRPRPELLEDDLTAFAAPGPPGELLYRPWPGGADALSDVTGDGYSFVLADRTAGRWCAVVPDPDGAVRGRWEDPGDA